MIAVSLLAIALFFQSIEYWSIRREFMVGGIWSGPDVLLNRMFVAHLSLRFALLPLIFVGDVAAFAWSGLVLSQIIICLRVRFCFSGGVESILFYSQMVALISVLFPGLAFPQLFLATIVLSSYVLAGLHKLRQKKWRQGRALPRFLFDSWYSVPSSLFNIKKKLSGNGTTMSLQWLSWFIILSQIVLGFLPFVPGGIYAFIGVGIAFHFSIFYVFRLNRFFWGWLVTYPAVFILALRLAGDS